MTTELPDIISHLICSGLTEWINRQMVWPQFRFGLQICLQKANHLTIHHVCIAYMGDYLMQYQIKPVLFLQQCNVKALTIKAYDASVYITAVLRLYTLKKYLLQ